jgi:hypothetical protein
MMERRGVGVKPCPTQRQEKNRIQARGPGNENGETRAQLQNSG